MLGRWDPSLGRWGVGGEREQDKACGSAGTQLGHPDPPAMPFCSCAGDSRGELGD